MLFRVMEMAAWIFYEIIFVWKKSWKSALHIFNMMYNICSFENYMKKLKITELTEANMAGVKYQAVNAV